MQNQLAEFFMNSECRRDGVANVGMSLRCFAHHSWNVTGRVPSGRKHVRKNGDVGCSRFDAAQEPGFYRWIGKLHVRVAHDNARASQGLDEVGHADEHVIRLARFAPEPDPNAQRVHLLASKDPPIQAVLMGYPDQAQLIAGFFLPLALRTRGQVFCFGVDPLLGPARPAAGWT